MLIIGLDQQYMADIDIKFTHHPNNSQAFRHIF